MLFLCFSPNTQTAMIVYWTLKNLLYFLSVSLSIRSWTLICMKTRSHLNAINHPDHCYYLTTPNTQSSVRIQKLALHSPEIKPFMPLPLRSCIAHGYVASFFFQYSEMEFNATNKLQESIKSIIKIILYNNKVTHWLAVTTAFLCRFQCTKVFTKRLPFKVVGSLCWSY